MYQSLDRPWKTHKNRLYFLVCSLVLTFMKPLSFILLHFRGWEKEEPLWEQIRNVFPPGWIPNSSIEHGLSPLDQQLHNGEDTFEDVLEA